MRTRKKLLRELAIKSPHINIQVIYSIDEDIYQHWDGEQSTEELEAQGLTAYNVEVKATTICNGEMLEGNAYLGENWMKHPNECEEIHGYFPQMLDEALQELYSIVEIHI